MNRLKQEIQNRKQSKQYIKKSEGIGLGTLALGGLALANRKAISSHIRNIGGKLVRTKGKTKSTPLLEGSKSTTTEVLETPVRNNKPSNTARIQERLQNNEAESPYLQVLSKKKKLTKRERLARAEEIRKIAKNKSFSQGFVGLIEFARTPGAKDKKKRKKRRDFVYGAGTGSLATLAVGNAVVTRDINTLDRYRLKNARKKRKANALKLQEAAYDLKRQAKEYNTIHKKYSPKDVLIEEKQKLNEAARKYLKQNQGLISQNQAISNDIQQAKLNIKSNKLKRLAMIGLPAIGATYLGYKGLKRNNDRIN